MPIKPHPSPSQRPADADAAAMDIMSQIERLKIAAEQAGDTILAEQVGVLFEGYLNRYCDGKRADLEESLRHHMRRPKDFLN